MTILLFALSITSIAAVHLSAQQSESTLPALTARLAAMTAVTGYERSMVDTLLRLLPGAERDRAGNAVLTIGEGNPRRLVLCPLDEPGYVVGRLREDGYLTLRRVPGQVSPLFDQQLEGHRVTIYGKGGPVPGVVAVRSVHLTRGRTAPSEEPFTVDDAYVDIGARTSAEAAGLGIGVLAPVTLTKRPHAYGDSLLAAPVVGRRAACAALLQSVQHSVVRAKSIPPVMVAFAVEQELSERGLSTLASAGGPFDETLIVDGLAGQRDNSNNILIAPQLAGGRAWGGYPGGPCRSHMLALRSRQFGSVMWDRCVVHWSSGLEGTREILGRRVAGGSVVSASGGSKPASRRDAGIRQDRRG